jgi:hypothetical protein
MIENTKKTKGFIETPTVIAQIMHFYLGLNEDDSLLDLTAGKGALFLNHPTQNCFGCELDAGHHFLLQEKGYKNVINGDVFEVANKIEDESMDTLILNPPYGRLQNGKNSVDIMNIAIRKLKQGGKFNYYIEDVDIPLNSNGTRPNAKTLPPDSQGNITIQIDNTYIQNATSLSLARTLIHETAHAYMFYLSKTNYEFRIELNNYFIAHNNNFADAHHGSMSQFLLGMAISLYNWDKNFGPTNGSLGLDYYYKMAFGGMLQNGTPNPIQDVVQYIPNGDWQAIAQILENEATGNNYAEGIKEDCDE